MHSNFKAEIQALIDQHNEPELAHRRDYCAYLVENGRADGETLEEHIARFAETAAPWERLSSLGLTRMIRLAWGNDRLEGSWKR